MRILSTIVIAAITIFSIICVTTLSNAQALVANETSYIAKIIYTPDINPNSNVTSYYNLFNVPPVCKIIYSPGIENRTVTLVQSKGNEPVFGNAKIYEDMSCKYTLAEYIKKGWTIFTTTDSFEDYVQARYTNFVLISP